METKTKSTYKEIFFVNLIIIMIISLLYMFSVDTRIISVLASKESAIYRGNPDKPQIALMFNVYGGTEYIDGILKTLKDEGAQGTFFIGGMWAKINPDALKKIALSGNELGNHGYLHKNQSRLSRTDNINEITKSEEVVYNITGKKTTLFAPPSGDVDTELVQIADSLGYQTIMWTADTIDWRDQNTELITKRAMKKAQNGCLILMHPTKHTLAALPQIIRELKKQGYSLVTVSQAIK